MLFNNNTQATLKDMNGTSPSQFTHSQDSSSWVDSRKNMHNPHCKAMSCLFWIQQYMEKFSIQRNQNQLLQSCSWSVLLYGSESWTLMDTLSKRIEGSIIRPLGQCLMSYGSINSWTTNAMETFIEHYQSKEDVICRSLKQGWNCIWNNSIETKKIKKDTGDQPRATLISLNREQWKTAVHTSRN